MTAVMQIEQFDPLADEARLRSCHAIVTASGQLDTPELPPRPFAGFASWWARGYNGNPRQTWLAADDAGRPAGCYLLELPDRENPELAQCVLAVEPGRRREGLGTELLSHCARQAQLAGRTRLTGEARDDSAGALFAAAAGATPGIAEVMRLLAMDHALAPRLPALCAEASAHSAGYSLQSWLGATPREHLTGLTALSAAMDDAPRDAGVEPEHFDADRIAQMEQIAIAAGQQLYSVAARHDPTGQLAAVTQVGTDRGTPGWAFQLLTAVLRSHRGHRLGLLVKLAMLDLLAEHEPGLRNILTGNAGANEHMIAINERLGFRVSSVHRSWELSLG